MKLFGEDDNDAISLGGYLKEAYEEAERFSEVLQKPMRGRGAKLFRKMLLLRRLGSSMEAGRNTVGKLLNISPDTRPASKTTRRPRPHPAMRARRRATASSATSPTEEITHWSAA